MINLHFEKFEFDKGWKGVQIFSYLFTSFASLCLTGSVRHDGVCGGVDWIQLCESHFPAQESSIFHPLMVGFHRFNNPDIRVSGKYTNKVNSRLKYLLFMPITFCLFCIFFEIIDELLRKFVGDENSRGHCETQYRYNTRISHFQHQIKYSSLGKRQRANNLKRVYIFICVC